MSDIIKEESSPFMPGKPVSPELFSGRKKQMEILERCIRETSSMPGKQTNIFMIGERGIGKSSLASYIHSIAEKKYTMLGAHVYLGGTKTLEDAIGKIFTELFNSALEKKLFDKIKKGFEKLKGFGLLGLFSIQFNPPKEEAKELLDNFPQAINKLLANIKDDTKGLLLILDDINGLADNPEFAHWIKSTIDSIASDGRLRNLPLSLMLVGLEDRWDALAKHQESIKRIFNYVYIDKMNKKEIYELFTKAYKSIGYKVSDEALEIASMYSSGLPVVAHEIGEYSFYADKDKSIDATDMRYGVLDAADVIGTKYIESSILKSIQSEKYINILEKLNSEQPKMFFSLSEIKEILNETEQLSLPNFLNRMKSIGLIRNQPGKRGEYEYVQTIYSVYLFMKYARLKRRK